MKENKQFLSRFKTGSRRRDFKIPSTVPKTLHSPPTRPLNGSQRALSLLLSCCQAVMVEALTEAHSALPAALRMRWKGHQEGPLLPIGGIRLEAGEPVVMLSLSCCRERISRGRESRACVGSWYILRCYHGNAWGTSLPLLVCMDQTEAACSAARRRTHNEAESPKYGEIQRFTGILAHVIERIEKERKYLA